MLDRQPLFVHVTNIPTPYRTVFCNTLHESLMAFGYGLHVLYCADREPNRQWEIPYRNMTYPYEILPGNSPRIGSLYAHINPSVIFRLRQLRPEILLIAGSWNMPTALLAASEVLCGSAFRVFWSEGHADAVLNPTGLFAALRRYSLRSYDAFAVPNKASAQFLEAELGLQPPIFQLPNTVDDEFYSMARSFDKQQLRQELGLPLDVTVFVSVAQLIDRKGVRELAQAISLLSKDEGSCMLVLVGDGPLRAELETSFSSNHESIRIVGQQNTVEVRAWLAVADAFVLASKQDPNPLTVIEAAFAGLPLLVSQKAGNVRELVLDDVSGIEIPSVDVSCIAAILSRFCQLSNMDRCRLGAGAAKLADSGFRRKVVVQRFVETLLEYRNAQ